MSPRSKRRRTGDRCHGTGCGQPDCGDCHRQDEDAVTAAADASAAADTGPEQPGTGSSAAPPPPPSSPPTQAPSPGLAAMIAALEEKALRDLLLQSAASSQEIQRSIKDAYHRQVARPQPPPLLPQPLLTSHLMMQQAAAQVAAANNTTRSASITSTTTTRLPAVTTAAAAASASASPTIPTTSSTLSSHQHQHQHQQMMRPVTNFDHYSKSAWHALNDTSLLSLSGSRQYTMAGDVYGDVCDCVNAIDEMTRDDSPLGTKQNAIETLREIAKSVILAADTVGYEVRKELQHDSHISDVMVRVAESMSPEERLRTGRRADAKGTLISKLEWVRDEAEGHCLKDSEGFARVLELLKSGFASSGGSSAAAPIDLTS